MQRICVIGGSRYFGKLLVDRLLAAGHRVTVINRGSSVPPAGAEHLIVDRDDEIALAAMLGARVFDVVVDQVCYTPVQAAIAARVFGSRTRRYVMTSTIEVYDPASASLPDVPPAGTPVPEEAVDLAGWPVDPDLPWQEDAYLDAHYGEGKRQAEAVLSRARGFVFASVRSAHVLGGGAQEFTGRLAHYVGRVARGEAIAVHERVLPSVFIHHEELAELLVWAAGADFSGPVNACSDGLLDVYGLTGVVAARVGREPVHRVVTGEPGGGTGAGAGPETAGAAAASPFSFDRHYAMDNARAKALGFTFSRTEDWLPGAVDEAIGAGAGGAGADGTGADGERAGGTRAGARESVGVERGDPQAVATEAAGAGAGAPAAEACAADARAVESHASGTLAAAPQEPAPGAPSPTH